MALPPPGETDRRKPEADNPEELWDEIVGGATGAASDFSAFGASLDDNNKRNNSSRPDDGDAFDFDKMAEASAKLDEELHGGPRNQKTNRNANPAAAEDSNLEDDPNRHSVKIDPKRPLASTGTTIASGSGDGVNVFEDFDAPSTGEAESDAADGAVRGGGQDPSASSRLMKMIGVKGGDGEKSKDTTSNPWGASDDAVSKSDRNSQAGGASIQQSSSSIPLNPWGDPITPSPAAQQQQPAGGMDISARLESFANEQKDRESNVAQESEMLRRRQEEEAQRRAVAQRQAEEHARQQQAAQAAAMQQAANQQSQVELVLMERICSILETSWGRSDLLSILSTLHSEDPRVIPLLNNADSLSALIARSPQRIALRRDPNFAGQMAELLLTNAQWQQQQQQAQARAQQEELHRREQQRRMDEEAAVARARAEALNRLAASIVPDAPWFYSDPQQNIQVRIFSHFCAHPNCGMWSHLTFWFAGSFPRRRNEAVARGWLF